MDRNIQIGALISGGGTNLQAIIDACHRTQISGQMVFAGSDTPGAGGLERARRNDIATFVVDYKSIIREFKNDPQKAVLPDDFDLDELLAKQTIFSDQDDPARVKSFLLTRVIAEAKLLEAMKPHSFDLLVLAGFMRNLTPYFIDRINTDRHRLRIMNIHPALLPKYGGKGMYGINVHKAVLQAMDKFSGATVHIVDEKFDQGPILIQRRVPVMDDDTPESLAARVLEIEHQILPMAVSLFVK